MRGPTSNSFELEPLERRALLSTSGGLFGQYFDDANLSTLRMTRNDVAVNFDWNTASPYAGVLGADTFSVRWTGQLTPQFSQDYTLSVTADDGVRLWVGGNLVIDRWSRADEFPGDANFDGVVNLLDFNTLAANFNVTGGATWQQGDFNGDGNVNLLDFNVLAAHFNQTAPRLGRKPIPRSYRLSPISPSILRWNTSTTAVRLRSICSGAVPASRGKRSRRID